MPAPRLESRSPKPVSLPSQLRLQAAGHVEFIAAPGGEGKRPTFNILAYGGGILRFWFGAALIDLEGLSAPPHIPILLDHDAEKIIGQANTIDISAKRVKLAGAFTAGADDPDATKVITHAGNGFTWGASVGVDVTGWETVAEGQTVTVNGKKWKGPLEIIRSGRLRETSFVAVGADEEAFAKVAASGIALAREISAMTFAEWLSDNGFDAEDKLPERQRTALEAAWKRAEATVAEPEVEDPEPQPAPGVETDEALKAQRVRAAAELRRVDGIRKVCGDGHGEIVAKAIEEGWTVEKAELEVLRATRKNVGGRRTDGPPMETTVIEAALLLNRTMSEEGVAKAYGPRVLEQASSRGMRGFGLGHLFHLAAQAHGVNVRPGRLSDADIRDILRADQHVRASGFSTISLPGILGNVANRAMLERFQAIQSAILQIAYQTDTSDFKPFTRYRIDGGGAFSTVGPDGELKQIGLIESSYQNRLETKGGMITLTREMIINDDMGAFMQAPNIFAELAAYAVEQGGFTTLLGNAGNFFAAGNGNYFEGADSALGVLSLDTAVQKFLELKGPGGRFIASQPALLLVPPALAGLAKRIFDSNVLNETTSAGKPSAVSNPHAGQFRPIPTPYIGTASGIAGASDAAWYLLANPSASAAPLQIGFLNGARTPTLEEGQPDFNTLGIQFRAYFDFGIALFVPQSGVKSKGTA